VGDTYSRINYLAPLRFQSPRQQYTVLRHLLEMGGIKIPYLETNVYGADVSFGDALDDRCARVKHYSPKQLQSVLKCFLRCPLCRERIEWKRDCSMPYFACRNKECNNTGEVATFIIQYHTAQKLEDTSIYDKVCAIEWFLRMQDNGISKDLRLSPSS